jgi:very-short-patch-repair endonuclease
VHLAALSAAFCTKRNPRPPVSVGSHVLDAHLRRQDGVITVNQARGAGMSQDAIERRVRTGAWRRCSRGVFFADDRPFTDAARIRAEVWAHGDHAVAHGLTAAWWHGLTRDPPYTAEVTVPRSKSARSGSHASVRRRDLCPADVVIHRRLRVTGIPLSVLEAVAVVYTRAIMDCALQRGTTLAQLQAAHERNARRHGAGFAYQILREASDGARSEAERLLIRLLRAAKISGWKANFPVCGYVVDVAFPKQKVAIEVDGWAFHTDQATFQNDRNRQNRIALNGWQVLRFTWLDLTEHPQRVIAEIARAVSQRR